eukprot:GHVQ01021539.1.p1 GENE.GHVQ01021539.1~~GHVQ01021539.1.p1  ORF type:complete len:395 (+),score=79.87 GHVQ01021539.1:637-1821(+)
MAVHHCLSHCRILQPPLCSPPSLIPSSANRMSQRPSPHSPNPKKPRLCSFLFMLSLLLGTFICLATSTFYAAQAQTIPHDSPSPHYYDSSPPRTLRGKTSTSNPPPRQLADFPETTLEMLNASRLPSTPSTRVSHVPYPSSISVPSHSTPHLSPQHRSVTSPSPPSPSAAREDDMTASGLDPQSGAGRQGNTTHHVNRRWYPKANQATSYLDGMGAPDVAEIIKVTRTGNPVYDGITSVMTVADFGLRMRQEKLREQVGGSVDGEIDEPLVEGQSLEGGGGEVHKSGVVGVALTGLMPRNIGTGGDGGGGSKGHMFVGGGRKDKYSGGRIPWEIAEREREKEKDRKEKERKSEVRKSNRASFRKVVIDEALDQYFTDRQWFMQEVVAPVFAEEE